MTSANMAQNVSLCDLNLESLDHIFKHTEKLEDQFKLARAHPHLRSAFVYHNRDLFKKVCLKEFNDGDNCNWHSILKWCGPSITHIYDGGYCMTGEGLVLAQQYCPNLKYLNICITQENVSYVQYCLPKMNMLEEIELRGPAQIGGLLWSLNNLPILQKLSIWNFYLGLSETMQLGSFTNLKHLEITSLKHNQLQQISGLLRSLHILQIYTMPDSRTIRDLSHHCTSLTNLHLFDSNKRLSRSVPYFCNLRCLEIHDLSSSAYFLLSGLDWTYNNQLEKLIMPGKCIFEKEAKRISKLQALSTLSCVLSDVRWLSYIVELKLTQLSLYNCVHINNTLLLYILRECKTLKTLEITLCSKINSNFIDDALKILYQNGVQAANPLVLVISGSGMQQNVNNKLASHSMSNLLNLTIN